MIVIDNQSDIKEHILITPLPVCANRVRRNHPLLADEFPKGTLKCAMFPADANLIIELSSDPGKVIVVDIDPLNAKQIECLASARQEIKRSFFVYSPKLRTLELVIPGCKPGTCKVTLPRNRQTEKK